MQIATSCCLHRAMTFGKSKEYSRNLALILIASISVETVYHSVMDEHVVHELTFLLLIILVANQTRGLINKRVKQTEDKRMLKKLAIFGTGESHLQETSSLSLFQKNSADITFHRMLPLWISPVAARLHLLLAAHRLEACHGHALGVPVGVPRLVAYSDCHWRVRVHGHGR
jgi:hypothetical protein